MTPAIDETPLTVVVGAGGVGKTTVAASLALRAARAGSETLVMTFDPSRRLKDTLGIEDLGDDRVVRVDGEPSGKLWASLLDARSTFARLVERYSPDEAARERILRNRFYDRLAGQLAGILEYMAVERLFEIAEEGRFERVILDTPPTQQALDFLEAPQRVTGFLDSGALKVALKPWFDAEGRLRPARRFRALGQRFEDWLDRIVGLDLLREMAEFFQAFAPLYEGFRRRAGEVQALLRSPRAAFVLVAGPGVERVPDAMFFSRKLVEGGHRLAAVLTNRVHPRFGPVPADAPEGVRLVHWLGERDRRGVAELGALLPDGLPHLVLPRLAREPGDLDGLDLLGAHLAAEKNG